MKYVALLSGGKDSCYNLLHCSQNGHQLVAAASLGPEHGKEELDSYLYQTVGQDAIEFVARALDVPLYRRIILGNAIEQRSEYGHRNPKDGDSVQGDETEDLHVLLSIVKSHHPDIQGVSVGAILSNYQRVRVEHVCRRLSLTPLCYLWQRDQGELLSEMIEAGMRAVIIKVAGIGLTTKHLGKTLAEMQSTLIKLNDLYGSHICGEGGEYETLTLDCPLFKSYITLNDVETVIHSDNDFATVAFLRIKNAILERKDDLHLSDACVPPLLGPDFVVVREAVKVSQAAQSAVSGQISQHLPKHHGDPWQTGVSSKKLDSWVAIANIHRDTSENGEISLEEEVQECFHKLEGALSKYSLNLSHCANINVFLSSMDLFARVNAIYATFFGTSPPARACVAVCLPPTIRLKFDCIAYAECTPDERQALHVQGLSYWAPANIGPYSQAITVNERIFVSGQIGLVPSSLALPSPQSLALESALSFQHVCRITDALRKNSGGGWRGHTQTALYWLINEKDVPHAKRAHGVHEKFQVPTLFLVVETLPKDALIEKQVLLHTGRGKVSTPYDDESVEETPIFEQGESSDSSELVHWEVSQFRHSGAFCAIVCIRGEGGRNLSPLRATYSQLFTRSLSLRLFYNPAHAHSLSSNIRALFGPDDCPPCTAIPCQFISSLNQNDWTAAMYILGN